MNDVARLRRWGLALLAATLLGLLNASVVITANWAEGGDGEVAFSLLMELTGAWTLLSLFPVILPFMRRHPITTGNWWRTIPLHLIASVAMGVTHTLLMWGTRTFAFRMLNWGEYDYGLMRYRFLMEYQKQFLAYCLIYLAVAVLAYVRRGRERELQAAALRTRLSEARLSALKMQLNPHFLFNTLNMISSFTHSEPRKADAMISNLSDLLREALRHSDAQEVTLDQELRALQPYLDLMQARFDDRLRIEVDAPSDLRGARVPHLLLQPLVENAVTHGTARQTGTGHVTVTASRVGDRLLLVVADNGPGFDGPPAESIGRGVGLSNLRERLNTLYADRHRLDLANRPGGGARVTVELPWHPAENAGGRRHEQTGELVP